LGKLSVQGRLNAVIPSTLVHVTDQISGRRFLVDTGAAFSIFPHQSVDPPNGPLLSGPAGKNIPCWGERQLELSFNGRRFQWTFLLAAVQFPILGIDFLRHFCLLVDPAAGSLFFNQPPPGSPHTVATGGVSSSSSAAAAAAVKAPPRSSAEVPQVATYSSSSAFQSLLEKFPEVVNPSRRLPMVCIIT
jgi:hypothetical protein